MQTLSSNHFQYLIPNNKVLLSQSLDVKKPSLCLLKKLAPKYARHASIVRDDFRKRDLFHLKSVSSLSFHTKTSERFVFRPRSQTFQMIKSHKKTIHYCEGIHVDVRLAKELSRLCEYKLDYLDSEPGKEYHVLGYLFALKKIFLNLNSQFSEEEMSLIVPILQKNRTRITRGISRMRSTNQFNMEFSSQSSPYLFAFLQVFGSCPFFLRNLQCFSIVLRFSDPLAIIEDRSDEDKGRMALKYVTHLELPNREWFEILFDKESLENLISLRAEVISSEVDEKTIRKLSDLKLFTKLKHLVLNFKSCSKEMEHVFIESFTLPKDIESIELGLYDFVWEDKSLKLTESTRKITEDSFKNSPNFQRFYNQWESLDDLKALVLTIGDRLRTRSCPALTLSFAEGILKRVKNLRKLQYNHSRSVSSRINGPDFTLPMGLRELWNCLEGSKGTLENLEICVFPKMNFFEKESLESLIEFRNLRSLKIHGEIYGGINFGDFLTKLSKGRDSSVKVSIKSLYFAEGGQLKDFFTNINVIPKNLDVKVAVDASSLNWGEMLCEYMIKVRGEGRLNLELRLDKITHKKVLELLKEKSVRNSPLKKLVIQEQRSNYRCIIQNGNLIREWIEIE